VVDEGLIPGPSIYAAGSVLSVTGGHGDIHTFAVEWVHDTARMGAGFRLADGEADGDPLADLSLLADPSRITAVWRAGALVKG
jgi:hypothetical protein